LVVLRRNDSATSLLLFLYNNYLSEFNKDTLKLSSLLDIMRVFGKSESATRMSLSRTVKAGILINQTIGNEVNYSLSPDGKNAIKVFNEEIIAFWKRYTLRNKPWDNKWHLLNLEFTEENKEAKDPVQEKLRQLSFGTLAANTWISPHYQPEEIQQVLNEFSLGKYSLQMHGEITDQREYLIEKVFQLNKLVKPYQDFLTMFRAKFEETKEVAKRDSFAPEGQALPLMRELGWEFFFIAAEDPALPKTLQPFWVGDEAAQLMMEYRGMLLDATKKYLGKFE